MEKSESDEIGLGKFLEKENVRLGYDGSEGKEYQERVRGKGVCFSIFFGLGERSRKNARKNVSLIWWVSSLGAVTTCGVITVYQTPG